MRNTFETYALWPLLEGFYLTTLGSYLADLTATEERLDHSQAQSIGISLNLIGHLNKPLWRTPEHVLAKWRMQGAFEVKLYL